MVKLKSLPSVYFVTHLINYLARLSGNYYPVLCDVRYIYHTINVFKVSLHWEISS